MLRAGTEYPIPSITYCSPGFTGGIGCLCIPADWSDYTAVVSRLGEREVLGTTYLTWVTFDPFFLIG